LGRGAVVTGIAALAFLGKLEVWHLYAGGVVFGFADAFFQPAYAATVPEMVPRDDLNSANSITSLSVQTGRIAGPALGAGIIGIGGIPLAFGINAASFFASALCLLPLALRRAPLRGESAEQPNVLRDLREGFAFVMSAPWLWITIATMAITNVTLAGPYSVSLPFLVSDTLHRDVGTLGTIYAIFPIGYLVAAVWLGSVTRIRRRGWMIYLGTALAGAMLMMMGFPIGIVGICIVAFINGAALEAASLAWVNAMQEKVPPEMLGRVSSIDSLGSYALLPIGYAVAGLATDRLGAPMVFILGGAITTVLCLLALFHPVNRQLD
jgi:DHA3 family tetracycline resistance protein-like MFS transporter